MSVQLSKVQVEPGGGLRSMWRLSHQTPEEDMVDLQTRHHLSHSIAVWLLWKTYDVQVYMRQACD